MSMILLEPANTIPQTSGEDQAADHLINGITSELPVFETDRGWFCSLRIFRDNDRITGDPDFKGSNGIFCKKIGAIR
jgi:hypothetical protein